MLYARNSNNTILKIEGYSHIFAVLIIGIVTVLLVGAVVYYDGNRGTENIGRFQPTESDGVIYGKVNFITGNCMLTYEPPCVPLQAGDEVHECPPRTSVSDCAGMGVKTILYITTPTSLQYEAGALVKKIETDIDGAFETRLPPGDYSLFVYDNLIDWELWNECGSSTVCDEHGAISCSRGVYTEESGSICNPFTITAGERTEMITKIDHAAY